MTITSTAFAQGGTIPQKYTCQGESVIPPLRIADVPENAKSLALIVDDPDAPVGLFTHWLMWNIPVTTENIEDIHEAVMEGKNSAGEIGWIAPCPPSGTGVHHYRFQLFALDTDSLPLSQQATRQEVEDVLKDHDVERAELVGVYSFS